MNRAPRNPDLPILDDLRAQMRRRIVAEEVAAAKAPASAPRPHVAPAAPSRGRARGHAVRRITKRSLVIVTLLCLLAGVALAAGLGIRDGSAPRSTSPQLLGADAGARVFGYRDEGRLCLRLRSGGHGFSACGEAPDGALSAISDLVGGRRLVFGFAAAPVRRVTARVDSSVAAGAARRPRRDGAARAAGVPTGLRWYVIDLGRAGRAPARLRAFDATGRRVGSPLLDCSLDTLGAACRRLYADRAVERLH